MRGVRIIFAGSDGQEKTLYYFSTDLSNSGVKASGFLKFCETLETRQQSDQERLVSAALPQLHHGAQLPGSTTADHHHPGGNSGIPALPYYSTKKMSASSCCQ